MRGFGLLSLKSKLAALLRRGSPLEWAFALALATPVVVLTLVLRSIRVVERGSNMPVLNWIDVYKSDLFFLFGFVGLGLAALYATRGRRATFVVFAALQFLAILVALVEVVAFNFFMATGSTLDFQLIFFTLSQLMMTFDVVASEVPAYIWWMMAGSAVSGAVVPWGVYAGWKWLRRRLDAPEPPQVARPVRLGMAGVGALALLLGFWGPIREQSTAFARNATLTVVVSAGWSVRELLADEGVAATDTMEAVLAPRSLGAKKRNVVVILLESTRAQSVTVYNPELPTTPHLVELAKKSIVAERAYTVVPHTSKALVATLCGIEPRLHVPITEATPEGIPGKCLANLLADVGYRTAFFQSATQRFENRAQLTENMGYDTFTPLEKMSKKGWDKVNYFGNEDDIMLEPSGKWLDEVGDEPFLLTYLTLTPHHDYLAPRRYGRHQFAEDDELNRYLNTVHYVDNFVNNVLEMFKKKGLYEDTIFVIVGDHGEGFGEHGRRQHDNVIWQEGIWVPLIVHDPQRFQEGKRVPWTANQLDIIPTVVDLLGYEIRDATFPGASLLTLDSHRTVRAHCWYERRCMAAVRGDEKFIYHFDQRGDEYFNLAEDPQEKNNRIAELDDAERWRSDLIAWRSRVNALYRSHSEERLRRFVSDAPPVVEYPLEDVRFGEFVRLVGVEHPREELKPGARVSVTFVFEVLERPPVEWKLFLHGEAKGTKLKNLDHEPVDGLHPLEDWRAGEFISDRVDFQIPRTARDEYVLWLGFYHPKDGRAEVHGIESDGNRRAKAAVLKLGSPERPKPPPKKPAPIKLPPTPLKPTLKPTAP